MRGCIFFLRFMSALCLSWVSMQLLPSSAFSQTFDGEVQSVATRLSGDLARHGVTKVAVADILDYSGRVNLLGRYIADSLTTHLFMTLSNSEKKPSFELIERTRLSAILRELKLSAAGLVNPENARKIGNVAGVDALVVGNMVRMGDAIAVNLRVISTKNARILSARQFRIVANASLVKMLNMKLSSSVGGSMERSDGDISSEYSGKSVKTTFFIVRPIAASYYKGSLSVSVLLKNYTKHDVFVSFMYDNSGSIVNVVTDGGAVCKPLRMSPFRRIFENSFGSSFIEYASRFSEGAESTISITFSCKGNIGSVVQSFDVGLHAGVVKCGKNNDNCKQYITKSFISAKNIPIKILAK